jgi:hypothetical protein
MLLALLLSACAGMQQGAAPADAPKPDPYAGALTYPDRLVAMAADSTAKRWIDPSVDFRKYNNILIERIRVKLDRASSSVDPTDLKALTDYFQQAITKAIVPPYPVVDALGPDVLRVRITIIDLVSTKPAMSVVVLLTPYATLPDMLS